MRRLKLSSNMNELSFRAQVFGHARLKIEINEIHGMLQFFHQPAEQPVETLSRTPPHRDVQV